MQLMDMRARNPCKACGAVDVMLEKSRILVRKKANPEFCLEKRFNQVVFK
jgi:hypothetical protein